MSVFTTIITKGSITALVAAAAVVAGAPAFAAPFVSNGHVVSVEHADLDLRNAADQRVLKQRISVAADQVCAIYRGSDFDTCRAETLSHVRAQTSQAIARAETATRYAQADAVRNHN